MHHSDLVRVQQQEREQRPLLQAAQRNRPAVDRQSVAPRIANRTVPI